MFTFRRILAFVFICALSWRAAAVDVGRYQTLELVFTAQTSPTNPFDTYLLKLEVTDPSGTIFNVEGFFDGDGAGGQAGKVWKARLCPYQSGMRSWRTVDGDAPDAGLAGLNGTFTCSDAGDLGGLTSVGQQFKLQNGAYIYGVGNFLDFSNGLRSTHVYMSETTTDAQRDAIMTRQHDFHTSNKANIYFANQGDYSSQSVTPWIGSAASNDKTQMNLSRWKLYDGYIQRFKNNGMFAEMWYFADDSNFAQLTQTECNRLFRYGMARTSAFSHTAYVVCLEWDEAWTETQINANGTFLQSKNP